MGSAAVMGNRTDKDMQRQERFVMDSPCCPGGLEQGYRGDVTSLQNVGCLSQINPQNPGVPILLEIWVFKNDHSEQE